jgi:hypothetical protein
MPLLPVGVFSSKNTSAPAAALKQTPVSKKYSFEHKKAAQ